MSDNIDVPVGFTAAQGLGLEPQAQALAAGMAAIEKAMARPALPKVNAAIREALTPAERGETFAHLGSDGVAAEPLAPKALEIPPKAKRHVQRVEVRCLDCGWVQSYGFPCGEPREMKRIAFVGDQSRCPRCYARRCVQGGAA